MTTELEIGVEADITTKELAEFVGDQMILGDAGEPDFGYLAALALDCESNHDYDVTDTLMEFIREGPYDLDSTEENKIESMLRDNE